MKIRRIKTINRFRSLEPGFEIEFKPDLYTEDSDIVCLVGENGSGKSNVLELIAEIFSRLESYRLNYFKEGITHNELNAFEIEYYLPLRWGSQVLRMDDSFTFQDKYYRVQVIKEWGQWPKYFVGNGSKVREVNKDELIGELMPRKIWGYSSGYNEMISLPFWRTDLKYVSRLRKQAPSKSNDFVEESRLHFVDYEASALILLANFISYKLDSSTRLDLFKEMFDLEDVRSFKFTFRNRSGSQKSNSLISQLERFVDLLKNKLPANSIKTEGDNLIFNIKLDVQTLEIFSQVASNGSGFYRFFEALNFTNLLSIPNSISNGILLDGYEYSIDYGHLRLKQKQRPFQINEIVVRKENVEGEIQFRSLSDGEHQAITLIGLMNIVDEDACLFLLDEPETHLNPAWKYNLVRTIGSLLTHKSSQVFISTHDPLLISGLKKENVIQFSPYKQFESEITDSDSTREIQYKRYRYASEDLKGKGVDWILTSGLFGLDTTLDYDTKLKSMLRVKYLGKKIRGEDLSEDELETLDKLTLELQNSSITAPINDPIYRDVIAQLSAEDIGNFLFKHLNPKQLDIRNDISERIRSKFRENQ
jgi:restriction system-associated AAA family ATPase